MRTSHGAQAATLRKSGFIILLIGMLLTVGWALFPGPAARANDGCPHTQGRDDHDGGNGSFTAQAGGAVTWSTNSTTDQITVTVTGTAVICVKSAQNVTGQVTLTISDDGVGMAGPSKPGHFGLTGMDERAVRLGGKLTVTPNPDGGTLVRVEVPLRNGNPATQDEPANSTTH